MYQGSGGSATTGKWVTNGMAFYLINATNGAGLASTTVFLTTSGCSPTQTPTPAPTPTPTPTPAPSVFSASPNPIRVCDGTGLGVTSLSWSGSGVFQVRVTSPTGPILYQGSANSATTGKWVTNGMVFYLIDATNGAVLASTTVFLTISGCGTPTPTPMPVLTANPNPITVCDGTGLGVTRLSWSVSNVSVFQVRVESPTGPLLYQGTSNTALTGKWVTNGMNFYLLNASNGTVLGSTTVTVSASGCSP